MTEFNDEAGASRTVSAKQLAANRRNATRSTGPNTASGKARVARNAVTHGGYASITPIDRGYFREDPDELKAIHDAHTEALMPRNDLERRQIVAIATSHVRLLRYAAFEALKLTELTSTSETWGSSVDVFAAVADAALYAHAAQLLRQPAEELEPSDWDALLTAAATADAELRRIHQHLDPDAPRAFDELKDTILKSIIDRHGGSREQAASTFDALAAGRRSQIPHTETERAAALRGIRNNRDRLALGDDTATLARLSAAYDAEIRRFKSLRALSAETPPAETEAPTEATNEVNETKPF